MSIARLRVDHGRCAAARDALAPVYERFTQGLDTVDLRAARELLAACRKDNLPHQLGRMIGRGDAAEEITQAPPPGS